MVEPAAPDPARSLGQLRDAVTAALWQGADAVDALVLVGRACAQLLPVDGASISVMSGTAHRETVYASDEALEHIEALQVSLGEGPCFEAFTTGRPVLVADLAADSALAWPVFASEMSGEPVGAIFAFPLTQGAARVGAIDLYRRTPGWLTPPQLATALELADVATTALLGVPTGDGEIDQTWLATLPRYREQMHQATGMLIAEYAIPAEQALARLRGYAFATGRLVDEVSADLVARRLRPIDIDTG